MTAFDIIGELKTLGFVPDGHTRTEQVRFPTMESPVLGGMGGERRTLGGRQRFALPGTNIKATVGDRTTYLYRTTGRDTEEIAHLRTKEVTTEVLRALVGKVAS